MAQHSETSAVNSNINDDGKTYTIKIDGDMNGRPVHYDRSFNVAGMGNAQKDALKTRILDSLRVGTAGGQSTTDETSAAVTFVCPTCTGRMKLSISGSGVSIIREHNTKKDNQPLFPFELSLKPGNYRYEYWQNGVNQMQLPFTVKAGETNEIKVK